MFAVFVSDSVYVHNGIRFCEEVVKEEYESRSSLNYEITIKCKSSILVCLLFMEMLLTVLLAFLHVTWTTAFCDGRSAGAIAKGNMSTSCALALPYTADIEHGGGGGGGGIKKGMSNTHKRTTSDPLQSHVLLAKRVSSVM
jgi:hypothetical protein